MKYISLETVEVQIDESNIKDYYAFKIVSDSKNYYLKAKSKTDMEGW